MGSTPKHFLPYFFLKSKNKKSPCNLENIQLRELSQAAKETYSDSTYMKYK